MTTSEIILLTRLILAAIDELPENEHTIPIKTRARHIRAALQGQRTPAQVIEDAKQLAKDLRGVLAKLAKAMEAIPWV